MSLTIAVDGPVGAGKSSVARALAKALGVFHLDTGAMYRALAVKALREGIDPTDKEASDALAARTEVTAQVEGGAQKTLLDGEDVTAMLRTPEVSQAASAISVHRGVRTGMVKSQRAFAQEKGIVLDGRDIGTDVLPDAMFKFYLTASPETRAERRYRELLLMGKPCTLEGVLAELNERDERDTGRAVSPLHPAGDAIILDTTNLSQAEVIETLLNIIREARGE